ncbi:MAG TPA: acylphosphatase [Solirubrobacteraceae bacterium]|jgi:acylphosphatase
MSADAVRRRVVVSGHVQGVFFRDSTRERAEAEGVAGWACNRGDGAVEVVLEGPQDAVERVLAFLREGPSRASVESVEVVEDGGAAEGLSRFEIR